MRVLVTTHYGLPLNDADKNVGTTNGVFSHRTISWFCLVSYLVEMLVIEDVKHLKRVISRIVVVTEQATTVL